MPMLDALLDSVLRSGASRAKNFTPGNFSGRGSSAHCRPSCRHRPRKLPLMAPEETISVQDARAAGPKRFRNCFYRAAKMPFVSLIDNPTFRRNHVCLCWSEKTCRAPLPRKLPNEKRGEGIYRVRRALAAHPHTPRLIAVRLLRDLHLMDLVRISLLPTSSGELRRLAEERVLAQLPQLPLGQRLMLAPARFARALPRG